MLFRLLPLALLLVYLTTRVNSSKEEDPTEVREREECAKELEKCEDCEDQDYFGLVDQLTEKGTNPKLYMEHCAHMNCHRTCKTNNAYCLKTMRNNEKTRSVPPVNIVFKETGKLCDKTTFETMDDDAEELMKLQGEEEECAKELNKCTDCPGKDYFKFTKTRHPAIMTSEEGVANGVFELCAHMNCHKTCEITNAFCIQTRQYNENEISANVDKEIRKLCDKTSFGDNSIQKHAREFMEMQRKCREQFKKCNCSVEAYMKMVEEIDVSNKNVVIQKVCSHVNCMKECKNGCGADVTQEESFQNLIRDFTDSEKRQCHRSTVDIASFLHSLLLPILIAFLF